MNYINKIKKLLNDELNMSSTMYEGLLDYYGLLVLTVGENCTQEHIHDAWSFWQNKIDDMHRSLYPFDDLKVEDIPY